MVTAPEHKTVEFEIPADARQGYLPIKAYGLIGDRRSAALVATDGAIDWLCLPRFDSPAIFCRILDRERGGFIAIQPESDRSGLRGHRRYRSGSNVLETTLRGSGGTLRLTDVMPRQVDPDDDPAGVGPINVAASVIRQVEAVDGPVSIVLSSLINFNFAAEAATIELVPGDGLIANAGDTWLAVAWPGELQAEATGHIEGRLTLNDGQVAICVVSHATSRDDALAILGRDDWADLVERTDRVWQTWTRGLVIEGPYADALLRSALTLRMLTYQPTGAIVAAPTTSLPEHIGGNRNWDYRYCWLRDTTFTLYSFWLVHDVSAAHDFWRWILHTCAGLDPARLQIMFGLDGECDLSERILIHLSGYMNSSPVRIGNAAARQVQLDVFGELLDAFHFYYLTLGARGKADGIEPDTWRLMRAVADYICEIWTQPDQGLWEMRSEPRDYVYSKVMCWVGLDRAVRLNAHEPELFRGDTDRWRRHRDAIREQVLECGFNPEINSFTMSYGSTDLDAALLRLPLVGFLPATDDRMRATIERIQSRLGTDGLLKRYGEDVSDGLPPGEGAFAICSFWLIACLIELGDLDAARSLYDHLLSFGNDLGLFAEEIEPATGAALGNFPQGFTHIGIIDAGVELTAALHGRGGRFHIWGSVVDRAAATSASAALVGQDWS